MRTSDLVKAVADQLAPDAGGRPVLLGVSGGLDSMTLWALVRAADIPHGVAHVDYGLRRDSDLDRQLVVATAERHGAEAHVRIVESVELPSSNLQSVARTIRMQFFADLLDRRGYGALALGHHADDQLEGVLIGLVRGGGPRALSGMAGWSDHIVRPLLRTPRAVIAQVAAELGVEFRHDVTNDTDAYLRNRIRRHVVPALLGVREGALAAAGETAEQVRSVVDFAEGQFERALAGLREAQQPRVLRRDRLRELPGLQFFFHECLRGAGSSAAQVRAAVALVTSGAPEVGRANRIELPVGRSFVLVVTPLRAWVECARRRSRFAVQLSLSGPEAQRMLTEGTPPHALEVASLSSTPASPSEASDPAGGDAVTLHCRPTDRIVWRTAERGDRLRAGGGTTRVRSVLAQAHRPPVSRGWGSVITVNGEVVWVVGLRVANPLPEPGEGSRPWRLAVRANRYRPEVRDLPLRRVAGSGPCEADAGTWTR